LFDVPRAQVGIPLGDVLLNLLAEVADDKNRFFDVQPSETVEDVSQDRFARDLDEWFRRVPSPASRMTDFIFAPNS
jgi:hypothetical protein